MTQAQATASRGYVLGATEGEHLVHFRDHGNIFIKAGSATGSDSLALGTQQELLLLWTVSPAGLDGFFRETCNPPGVPPKHLTREQINEIARKYATEFR